MRYMGGKSRIAKQLAEVIDRTRRPGQLVWDAFCGGLSMSVALSKNGPVRSTDACAPLIALYQAVQSGWDPPTEVSLETYRAAKLLPDTDPLKAFCGFGCSFGGKWFGGYAAGKNGPLTYPQLAARNVKRSAIADRGYSRVDFLAVEPEPTDTVFYLDPPYKGATTYAGVDPFDHQRFVERIRSWAQHTHVFVSEYSLPIGECVWSRASCGTLGLDHGIPHVERLYHLHPGNV